MDIGIFLGIVAGIVGVVGLVWKIVGDIVSNTKENAIALTEILLTTKKTKEDVGDIKKVSYANQADIDKMKDGIERIEKDHTEFKKDTLRRLENLERGA